MTEVSVETCFTDLKVLSFFKYYFFCIKEMKNEIFYTAFSDMTINITFPLVLVLRR